MSAPRRDRRVFDVEGREVFITYMCLKCRRMRPLSAFGLRTMGYGKRRNIPWCGECRGTPRKPGEPKPNRRAASARAVEAARRKLAAKGIEVAP